MKHAVHMLLIGALTSLLAGCWWLFIDQSDQREYIAALKNWLDCAECKNGELRRVVDYGDTMVPTLVLILEEGASPMRKAGEELSLRESYRKLYWDDASPPITEEDYVSSYLDGLDRRHRARAVHGLVMIGGDVAELVLRATYKTTDDELLKRTIKASYETAKEEPFPG